MTSCLMFQRPTYTNAWSQKVREQKSSKFGCGFFSWIYNAYCACANFLWQFPYELSKKTEMVKDEGIDLSVILSNQAPGVLNTPWCTHVIPRCTHGIPPVY